MHPLIAAGPHPRPRPGTPGTRQTPRSATARSSSPVVEVRAEAGGGGGAESWAAPDRRRAWAGHPPTPPLQSAGKQACAQGTIPLSRPPTPSLTMVTRLPNHWCASSCATTNPTYRLSSTDDVLDTSSAVSLYVIAPAHARERGAEESTGASGSRRGRRARGAASRPHNRRLPTGRLIPRPRLTPILHGTRREVGHRNEVELGQWVRHPQRRLVPAQRRGRAVRRKAQLVHPAGVGWAGCGGWGRDMGRGV